MPQVEMRIDAPEVRPEIAQVLVAGDWAKLWTREDFDRINIYARGTVGGQGLIGTITKSRLPLLARHWDKAHVTVESVNGCHVVLMITFEIEEWEAPE